MAGASPRGGGSCRSHHRVAPCRSPPALRATVSNFAQPWDPTVAPLLVRLEKEGLIDKSICFAPRAYSAAEKKALVSPRATGADLGGVDSSDIGDQFFNELRKREVGRQECLAAGCDYFMCLDCDEFYIAVSGGCVRVSAPATDAEALSPPAAVMTGAACPGRLVQGTA